MPLREVLETMPIMVETEDSDYYKALHVVENKKFHDQFLNIEYNLVDSLRIGNLLRETACAALTNATPDILAPFAVFLNENDKTYLEPDLRVICDKNKLTDKGCNGAPDWIIEIVSPSSKRMDYMTKLFKYRSSGVREY